MTEPMNLTAVLDHMDDKVHGERGTIGEIIDAFGGRGYGPILIAIALIEILPTGAIPGVPTLVAALVVVIAGQLAMGKPVPWIPEKLRKRGFSERKFVHARGRARKVTQKIDKVIKPRLCLFTTALAARIAGAVCVLLAVTMPPLEIVPFASSAPSLAIVLFGIGLSARDGLMMLLGFLAAMAAAGGAVYWLAF